MGFFRVLYGFGSWDSLGFLRVLRVLGSLGFLRFQKQHVDTYRPVKGKSKRFAAVLNGITQETDPEYPKTGNIDTPIQTLAMSQKYWYLLTVDHIAGSQGRANDKILALLLLPLPQPPLLLRLLLLHALLPSYLSPSFLFLLLPSCPSSFFPALLPSLRSYLSC